MGDTAEFEPTFKPMMTAAGMAAFLIDPPKGQLANVIVHDPARFRAAFRALVDGMLQLDAKTIELADAVNEAQAEFEKSRPDLFEPFHEAERKYRDARLLCAAAVIVGIANGIAPLSMRSIADDNDAWQEIIKVIQRYFVGDGVLPVLPKSNPFE